MTEHLNRIGHSTAAYTKAIATSFRYETDPEVSRLGIDDWEHQTRLHMAGKKLDFVPQMLAVYRISENGVSATRNNDDVVALKKKIMDGFKVAA
jgi:hypothetical protein